MADVTVADIPTGNRNAMTLIGGMNVIESRDIALRVAETFVSVTQWTGPSYFGLRSALIWIDPLVDPVSCIRSFRMD